MGNEAIRIEIERTGGQCAFIVGALSREMLGGEGISVRQIVRESHWRDVGDFVQ
jgi:hypothetical protein